MSPPGKSSCPEMFAELQQSRPEWPFQPRYENSATIMAHSEQLASFVPELDTASPQRLGSCLPCPGRSGESPVGSLCLGNVHDERNSGRGEDPSAWQADAYSFERCREWLR